MIVADYLSLSDLLDDPPPAISRLVSEGGVGLLIPAGGGSATSASAYTTAGAGAFAWANGSVDQAYSSSETTEDEFDSAGTIFKRRTGSDSAPEVVHLETPFLAKENLDRLSVSLPGALGDALACAGKKVAVFGNADLTEVTRRRSVAIAATQAGAVAFGDVSARILRRAPFSPTGFVTDCPRIASEVGSALKSCDFVVVDFGDTARVELSKKDLSESAYEAHRKNAITNLDGLIARILQGYGTRSTIMLASFQPPISDPGEPSRLSPIVIRAPGGMRGSLISATTRTPGLVTGFDLAPTVLASLRVGKSGNMIGAPIETVPGTAEPAKWMDGIVVMNRKMLWVVLGIFAGLGIASVTAACVVIWLGRPHAGRLADVVPVMLILTASSPIAMLLATMGETTVGAYAVRLLAWLVALTGASFVGAAVARMLLRERVGRISGALPVVVLAVIVNVVILIDACFDGQLTRFSLPGAAGFRGYRFYGVGNEYTGIWMAMAIVAIVWIRELYPGWESRRWGRALMLAVSAIIVVAIGFPRFGANAGGMMTGVVGLGLVYLTGVRQRFRMRDVAFLVAAGLALVITVGFFDSVLSREGSSHLGRAASMSSQEGWGYMSALVIRKMAMNISLIGTTQAQVAILGSVPFFALWVMTVGKKVGEYLSQSQSLRWGVIAMLPAAAVSFLFNDSGIVESGLVFSYVVLAILYTVLSAECWVLRKEC